MQFGLRVHEFGGLVRELDPHLLVLVDLLLQILHVPPESGEVEILSLLCEWVGRACEYG